MISEDNYSYNTMGGILDNKFGAGRELFGLPFLGHGDVIRLGIP